jgi:hypothetical protein
VDPYLLSLIRLCHVVLSSAQGQLYLYHIYTSLKTGQLPGSTDGRSVKVITYSLSAEVKNLLSSTSTHPPPPHVLDDRGSRVRFPAGAGNFSLHHRVQNDSGAHPASYPMGTRGSFPDGKAVGA